MAVRQYVGARYVPLYVGNWDATQNYEPLTIVTDANGNSFTSLKDVPAGTALTNRDYWIQTSSFSGAVDQLQRRVGEVESNIETLETSVEALETSVETLEKRTLHKTELVIIGDSWGQNNPSINDMLSVHLGVNVHNYCQSGTGFDVPAGYDAQIETMKNDSSYDHDKIKYIILIAGLNEQSAGTSREDFAIKVNDWYDKLSAAVDVENIPVYWFQNYSIENQTASSPDVVNKTTFAQQWTYYYYVRKNITNKIIYVPMFGLIKSWMAGNWRHPDADGYESMNKNIINILNGLPPEIYKYCSINGTVQEPDSSKTFERGVTLDYYLDGFDSGILKARLLISPTALGTCSNNTPVVFERNLPSPIPNCMLANNTYAASSGYTGFNIREGGTRSWTANIQFGYIYLPCGNAYE